MKVFKRSIFVVIILLMCFLEVNVVNAAPYDGYIYQAEEIDGIYFYKHRSDSETEKYDTHNFHEQATIYRRSSDDHYVYCIENWKKLTGASKGDYTETTIYTNNTGLTDEQLSQIELIGYFGYGYKDSKYDHTDKKWYAITQYLIWKIESPNIETYFVNSITSTTPLDIYKSEIKEIETLVIDAYKFPRFDKMEYNIFDTIHLRDLDNTMSFDKTHLSTIRSTDIKINGNDITIKPKEFGDSIGELTIYHAGSRFYYETLLYVSKNFQNAILIGDYSRIYNDYYLQQKSIKLDVNVYCEQVSSFSNKFNYQNNACNVKNNKVYIYALEDTYNSYGDLIFKRDQLIYSGDEDYYDLYPTKYYIKMEKDIDGYFSPIEYLDFSNLSDEYISVDLIYLLQKGKIESQKYKEIFSMNLNNIDYSFTVGDDFEFGLYANSDISSGNNILFRKDDLIVNTITNELGEIYFDIDIPYGSYYLKELNTNPLYEINDLKYDVDFQFFGSDLKRTIIIDDIYNYLNKCMLNIQVKDEKNNRGLSPITIEIYDSNKKLIYVGDTDDDGNILIELPYGDYYIKQVSTLPEYDYSSDFIETKLYSNDKLVEIINKKTKVDLSGNVTIPPTDDKEEIIEEGNVVIDKEDGFIIDIASTLNNDYLLLAIIVTFIISSLGLVYAKKIK